MNYSLLSQICLATLAGALSTSHAMAAYDLIICANVNRNYVIGSQIVTTNGLFQLQEDATWTHFGVNDTTINGLAIHPHDRRILFTTTLNGLWRSLDGGSTWRILNGGDMTEGRAVVVDPNNPDHLYLALPDGIAWSNDRGDTLVRRETGLPERGRFTQSLAVDRTRSGRVLAGTASGIYRTENAGVYWHRVLATETTVNDIQQCPRRPELWIAATDFHGVWISHDGGNGWEKIDGLSPEHAWYNIAFDFTNPARLAAGGWHHGLWTSEDAGKTWQNRSEGLPEPHRVWRVGIHPQTGRLYASVFRETLYHSDDFGRSWQRDTLEDGSLVHNFVIVPRAQP